MTTRQVLLIGAIVGLSVSIAILSLVWYGVAGVLNVGRTDLMYVFWPSSLMLTVGWRTTLPGISTTVVSVALNCLLYLAVAYGLYRVWLPISRSLRT